MNRVVHAHIKNIMLENPAPDDPVFLGGGSRPNARFQELCALAGIKFKANIETGEEKPWELKDLRKTCATHYDEHMPESSIEILGHSVGGATGWNDRLDARRRRCGKMNSQTSVGRPLAHYQWGMSLMTSLNCCVTIMAAPRSHWAVRPARPGPFNGYLEESVP